MSGMVSVLIGICRFVSLLHPIFLVIGYWNIFKKFGVKKWWAFIPIYNVGMMARCAQRDDDGKVYAFTYFFFTLLGTYTSVNLSVDGEAVNLFGMSNSLIGIIQLIFCCINLVYAWRIYKSLCKIFGVSTKFTLCWLFFDGITSLYFGLNKKLQPSITYFDDIDAVGPEIQREKTDKGLSIDIKSRTAGDGLKRKTLLRDIHLDIEPGNMVLLLGGSGAGKTTFLNAVTGYEKADAEIMIDGENVYENFDKLKYKIGFVPQQDLIRYRDTVYNTVADAASLKLPTTLSREERNSRVEEVLGIFGLLPVKNGLVAKQSGGQKKRISIATEFVSDPSVFILDEPDSGLDGIMARELMNRLHEISRQGKIVIVITHTPDRVIDLFDKVIVLAKDENRTGRLVYYGSVDDARKFFEKDKMEDIIKAINRTEEGGEGRADELLARFTEAQNGEA